MAMTTRQIQEFEEKKRVSEESSLKSTEETLRILRDTQTCGIATAKELNNQGEQLKRIDRRLDDLNGALETSRKQINGLKAMFGGFKNLFGKRDSNVAEKKLTEKIIMIPEPNSGLQEKTQPYNSPQISNIYSASSETQQVLSSGLGFDSRLNANMNEMSRGISMLKSLAIDIGQQLDEQEELIQGISIKTDQADESLQQQNKQMKQILRK